MLITSSKKYKSQWKENLFQHDLALVDTLNVITLGQFIPDYINH